jgi:hypothetical protein
MVGETLEQHCETEFNRIRATEFPRSALSQVASVSVKPSSSLTTIRLGYLGSTISPLRSHT